MHYYCKSLNHNIENAVILQVLFCLLILLTPFLKDQH